MGYTDKMQTRLKVLYVICSCAPNPFLYGCIESLCSRQIDCSTENKICIVDSDSSNFSQYERVKTAFPDVEIHYAKNKNYEYGAWKYALEQYPDYDVYFCIQDSLHVQSKINLHDVNDKTALLFYHVSGFHSIYPPGVPVIIPSEAIELIKDSGLDYSQVINTRFTLATHSSFVVSNAVLRDIFTTLTKPAVSKGDSINYERVFGLYFILKNIRTIDIQKKLQKIHGGRN